MKPLWLLLAIAVPFQFIHAQEVKHAPTVEQCRADQRLWFSVTADVSFEELQERMYEMIDCMNVDPQFHSQYAKTISEAKTTIMLRFMNFLVRHNLYSQFLAEDAQGKR